MENTIWKDHMTTKYLLDQANEKKTDWEKKISPYLRGESLLKEVIEGITEGNKERGKPCIIKLDYIKAED